MKWRRGLLFAGTNLMVAVSMILLVEERELKALITKEEIMANTPIAEPPKPPPIPQPENPQASQEDNGETVSFDLCNAWVHYPTPVVVMQGTNLPSLIFTGWEQDCPAHWSLAGRLRGKMSWPPTPLWMETQRKIDGGLCLMVAVQWLLIGSFPLARTNKWWADPGAFITVCAVFAGAIALAPLIDGLARLPSLLAMLAWFWWFGFLVWRALQLVWRIATSRRLLPAS